MADQKLTDLLALTDVASGDLLYVVDITDTVSKKATALNVVKATLLDEDAMTSNSASQAPTQQSVKAYVDGQTYGITELSEDTTPQLGGNLDVNGHNITGYLPSIDEDNMASNSNAYVPTQQSVVAYVASEISGAVGLTDVVDDTSPQLGGNLDFNSNGIGTTGTPGLLRALVDEVVQAATDTLTAAECSGTIINNYGQTEANTQTLPAAAKGLSGTVVIATAGAGAFHLKAGAGDKIYLDGTALDDGDKASIATPAVGNSMAFYAFQTGSSAYDWIVVSGPGTTVTDGGA